MEHTAKLAIVSCTRLQEEEKHKSQLYKSYKDGLINDSNIVLDIWWNNKKGMPEIYNKALEEYKKTDMEFVIFCHDDVYIDDLKVYDKLKKAHYELGYDIIGVAGGLNPKVTNPALWHIMTERNQQRGEAAHPCGQNQTMTTSFGPTPSRVAIMDGLFMAVHVPSIAKTDWKFNENYTFHHYDIASSIDANRKQLKLGVFPIHLVHSSPGLMSIHDKVWAESNEKFLKEYSS